ncbi:hypothetical protein D3C87_2064650 [compost metagenome]
MVSARTVRAYCTQAESEIASTMTLEAPTSRKDGGRACRASAETRMAISMVGIDRRTSPARISRPSAHLP